MLHCGINLERRILHGNVKGPARHKAAREAFAIHAGLTCCLSCVCYGEVGRSSGQLRIGRFAVLRRAEIDVSVYFSASGDDHLDLRHFQQVAADQGRTIQSSPPQQAVYVAVAGRISVGLKDDVTLNGLSSPGIRAAYRSAFNAGSACRAKLTSKTTTGSLITVTIPGAGAQKDKGIGISDAAGHLDLERWATYPATFSLSLVVQGAPDRLVRVGSTRHRNRCEPVELQARFLPFFPGQKVLHRSSAIETPARS